MSSRIVTLFTEPPPTRNGPSAFVVSTLLHCVVCGMVVFAINHEPRAHDLGLAPRYTVRLLKLRQPESHFHLSAPAAAAASAAHAAQAAAGGAPAASSAPLLIAHLQPAPQILIQPDLPQNLLPTKAAIPTILMWSAQNSPQRVIVAPPPQPLAAARVHPSLEAPNREVKLADMRLSSSTLVTHPLPLESSTTAPVALDAPRVAEQIPTTTSKPLGAPTPARVISLSDLQMPDGTVAVPMANESAATAGSGLAFAHGLAPAGTHAGTAPDASDGGAGQGSKGTQQGNGTVGTAVAKLGGDAGSGAAGSVLAGSGSASVGGSTGGAAQPGAGAANGDGAAENAREPAMTHLKLRKDGNFGVVVVGSSIEQAYPETAGIWNGRLAYTVYLHVGTTKNWILQYALPRDREASTGSVARPDAPWPYDIMRPHLTADEFNADAVMVHGTVNAAGRFEKLGVVFPVDFAEASFLLSALQQWQFRPASQNGQIAAVEILLIIPEEAE